MTLMTAAEEVKREASAPRGSTDEEQMIDEAAATFADFEEFWRACAAMMEAEADISETLELVAEKKGWSAQLVRRRRSQ